MELGDFFANADANYVGKDRIGGNYHTGNSDNTMVDIDPMDMSESMQEAMHRSNLEMRYISNRLCSWSPGSLSFFFLIAVYNLLSSYTFLVVNYILYVFEDLILYSNRDVIYMLVVVVIIFDVLSICQQWCRIHQKRNSSSCFAHMFSS